MSLIALTYNYGAPILFGDILISSRSLGTLENLPFSKVSLDELPKGLKYLPVDVKQKLYLITDNLAIALAGLVSEMEVLLAEIENNFKYRDCNWENICSFINDFKWEEEFVESSLILLYHTADNFNVYYHGPCEVVNSSQFGKIIASGSGARSFISTVHQETLNYGPELALPKIIILSTKFLIGERHYYETILDYWGAGFEFIYWKENKLQKLKNITHVVLGVKLDLDSGLLKFDVDFLYNTNYINNILILSVFDNTKTLSKLFVVNPINIDLSEVEHEIKPYFNLQSTNYCLTYMFENTNGEMGFLSYVVDEEVFRVRIKPEEDGIVISISEEFENHILNYVLEKRNQNL